MSVGPPQTRQGPVKQSACIDCEYSEPVHLPEGMMRCRRYAPRPAAGKEPQGIAWPIVEALDWCGEFLVRMPPEGDDPLDSFRPGSQEER